MSESKLVIAHVFSVMDQGGAETRTMDVFRHINHSKYHFIFLVHDTKVGYYDEEIKALGGRIVQIRPFSIKTFIPFMKSLHTFFKDYHVDVLHNHITNYGVFHHLAARKYDVRIRISHMRSEQYGFGLTGIIRRFLAMPIKYTATHRLAVSSKAGKKLYKRKPFMVMPNAIDVKRFRYQSDLRMNFSELYHLKNKIVWGHVGRFFKEKNHIYLINLFDEYHKEHSDSKLLLIGKGPLKTKTQAYVQSIGLENDVIFLPSQPNIHQFLCTIDILVFPSIFEGLPGVVVEAQAASTPCIISDNITSEVIFSNFVKKVPLNDKKSWLIAIQELLKLRNHRESLVFDATKFDIRHQISKYEDLYDESSKQSLTEEA